MVSGDELFASLHGWVPDRNSVQFKKFSQLEHLRISDKVRNTGSLNAGENGRKLVALHASTLTYLTLEYEVRRLRCVVIPTV